MHPHTDTSQVTSSQLVQVVEPDSSLRASLVSVLFANGFNVKSWESGEAFLRDGDLINPGSLILNHGYLSDAMPVVNALRARNSPIKIIILSAHGKSASPVDEALKLGVLAWLEKPCANDELIQWTQRALAQSYSAV